MAAGLVNSASGTVVKVIFNTSNAEMQSLLDGQHVPLYCIVVDFSGFHGFWKRLLMVRDGSFYFRVSNSGFQCTGRNSAFRSRTCQRR